ncbi:MAG TPA: LLM class flavin-dependent oxidoreductase [Candidatus Sulfomarinibacteraceae bacterium]|nr:LLM class flavin-dependent oxidoreductase [Candidatus Sulfomarinibacteraceae bacterium]
MTLPLSILDLSPISADSSGPQALRNSLDLARRADRLGYTRYWFAEHHNLPSVASSTPEVMIGQAARETQRIRVGAGGVMLPNHTPLKVVETFRVLEALYPGRIDLGIGRAPGTDQVTAMALRRNEEAFRQDFFPRQLAELLAFGGGEFPHGHPFRAVSAMPRDVTLPPVWLLGSSNGYSAQAAGEMGLGFAFALHINPDLQAATAALQSYRRRFRLTDAFPEPHAILALSVICAEDEKQAAALARPLELSYVRLRQGRFEPLASPQEAAAYKFTPAEQELLRATRRRHMVGKPQTVRERIEELVDTTEADEVMVMTMTYDHADRVRSYELLAQVFGI